MKHSHIRLLLSAYLDGVVTPEERNTIEEHLRTCNDCRVALDELAKTSRHVKGVEEIEPPAWLAGRIIARVKVESEKKKGLLGRLFLPLRIRLPVEVMALLLVCVTGYLVFRAVQPKVRLSDLAVKEERAPEAPSPTRPVAPATVPEKGAAKKESRGNGKAGSKTEGRGVIAIPPEAPAAPVSRPPGPAVSAPVPAPRMENALSSEEKAAAPTGRRYDAGPMEESRSDRLEQQAAEAGPSALSEEPKKSIRADTVSRKAKPAHKKPMAGIRLVLGAGEGAASDKSVEEIVARLGGKVIKRASTENTRIITCLLYSRKIDALVARLRTFGKVTTKGTDALDTGNDEETAVVLEIVREPRP